MPKPKKQPFAPLGDRILITAPPREKAGEEKTVGGIVIPAMVAGSTRNNIDSPHMVSVVLAVGEACKLVEVGDRIVVRKPNCFVVALDDVEHVMIREGDVVARVK